MKKIVYKVCGSTDGFKGLEKEVSEMLNQGWKPVGGIAFNAGYPHQAMARVIEVKEEQGKEQLSANAAMKKLDEIT